MKEQAFLHLEKTITLLSLMLKQNTVCTKMLLTTTITTRMIQTTYLKLFRLKTLTLVKFQQLNVVIFIYSGFNFLYHFLHISNKLSWALCALSDQSKHLTSTVPRKNLYYTLFKGHLSYAV
jgi:hypothetical protein